MAVPKHKKSKSKRNMRRHHIKAEAVHTVLCAHCGEPKLPHRMCPNCGFYRGRKVVEVEGI